MTMKRNSLSFQLKSFDSSALFSLNMSIFVSGESLKFSDWAGSIAATVVAILESRETVGLAPGIKNSGLAMAPNMVNFFPRLVAVSW